MSLALVALFAPLHAATIKVTAWTASSTAPATESTSYDVAQLGDGKVQKGWVEGEAGAGLGAWIAADFGGSVTLTGMSLWTGNWSSGDAHEHYGRPKTVVVEFSDGSQEELALADGYTVQTLAFKKPHATASARLKIKAAHAGKGPDTALSEVVFLDDASPPQVAVKSSAASSVFSDSYAPLNAADGALDSLWCEGNTKSDGTGEWVEFSFDGRPSISQLQLRNGVAYDFGLFMKSNKATAATLLFDDGTTAAVAIKPSSAAQTITFPAHATGKVRMTFTGVQKGKEFDDLCIAEANWLP
ncbi:MAG: type protein [Pseudomonadota bacterium]|jgi:hypothetical protein